VVGLLPGPRIPQVVVLLAGGVLIGPEVLDWASRPAIDLRANVGRGFLLEGEGSTAQSTVRLTVLLMVIPGGPGPAPVPPRPAPDRAGPAVLVTATALPLLVALAEIGLRNGTMLRENAAALVGAETLSVLVYPMLASGPGAAGAPGNGPRPAPGLKLRPSSSSRARTSPPVTRHGLPPPVTEIPTQAAANRFAVITDEVWGRPDSQRRPERQRR
jgi:hypothetical protein